MSQPFLEIRSLKAGRPTVGGTLEILIRAIAPERPADVAGPERPPLDLALVIDRSGSMSGQPLHEAKRCAEKIIEGLGARDQAALVVYDNRVDTLLRLTPASRIDLFRSALAEVDAGGSTDLYGGWEAGRDTLAGGGRADALRRVLLLSDGCANSGLVDIDPIAAHCRSAVERGIGTTTIGLGRHFNEDLMTRMAEAGGGRSYYGERAEDLLDAFTEEFALLDNLHSRGLQVTLDTAPGVRVVAVRGRQDLVDTRLPLPDIAWGAVSWTQITLEVEPGIASETALVTARLEGTGDSGPWNTDAVELRLPILDNAQLAHLPEDREVADRVADTKVAQLLEESRTLALAGDIDGARLLLETARPLAAASPWLAKSVASVERLLDEDVMLFAKETRFSNRKMRERLVASRAYAADEEMPAYLQTKERQGRRRDE